MKYLEKSSWVIIRDQLQKQSEHRGFSFLMFLLVKFDRRNLDKGSESKHEETKDSNDLIDVPWYVMIIIVCDLYVPENTQHVSITTESPPQKKNPLDHAWYNQKHKHTSLGFDLFLITSFFIPLFLLPPPPPLL